MKRFRVTVKVSHGKARSPQGCCDPLCGCRGWAPGQSSLIPAVTFFLNSDIRLHVEIHPEELTSSFYRTIHISPLLTFFSSVSACFSEMTRVQHRLVYKFLHSNNTQSEPVMMAKQIICELKPALYAESFHRVAVQAPFPEHYSRSMTNKNFKKKQLHFITSF